MGYILFSPIGKTDPITNYCDGSMLHICRVYKPQKVYLYISKEMLEFHHSDDRYRKAINYLAQKEQIEIDIEVIERPNLENVQLFDSFYDEFENILHDIQAENEGKILLNVSSGTPAMKSALQFLAIINIDWLPIQVTTPQKGANRNKPEFYDYDFDTEWELDEDNKDDFTNRCCESDVKNLNLRIKKEIIFKHLDAYDYQGALRVADTVRELIDEKSYLLLQGAAKRAMLDSRCDADFKAAGMDFIPVKSGDMRNIFEYLLILQIKEKREEYADFLRGLTPVVYVLFKDILKKRCKFELNDYCVKTKKDVLILQKDLLEKDNKLRVINALEQEFVNSGGFRYGEVNSIILATIIKGICEDNTIIDMTWQIRDIETKARNVAAHNIVSVTSEWVREKTGFLPSKIMDMLRKYAMMAQVTNNKNDWHSYDEMNETIKACMK